ncbi:MAG TPA: PQQ-dependent sugar dehydrogenase [Nitrospira sp.]|nr:PQQ-dependent sugar dehydrogenase [Nitrospira sp.]
MLLFGACNGDSGGGGTTVPPPSPVASNALRLEQVGASGVLSSPVFLTAPPGDQTRLFIVEQGGLIRILDATTGTPRGTPFLDVSTLITSPSVGTERGLLGMAFDPGFAPPTSNRRFYIYYTDVNGDIVIARYLVNTSNEDSANPAADAILKTIPHPTNANHNGGMLAFGPDRCLYAGIGDGGGGGDQPNNAQTITILLGKILRLDPETGNACTNLTNNPFTLPGGAPEVWSYGLRNPFRFSFDRTTGDLYIGDVGQNCREEVDVVQGQNAGKNVNFGWHLAEGFALFDPNHPGPPCAGPTTPPDTPPIIDYTHDGGACSIIGGYVYRGTKNAIANGTYFYGDLCAGFVRSLQMQNGKLGMENSWPLLSPPAGQQITSFGEDAQGELYIVTQPSGLFRVLAN